MALPMAHANVLRGAAALLLARNAIKKAAWRANASSDTPFTLNAFCTKRCAWQNKDIMAERATQQRQCYAIRYDALRFRDSYCAFGAEDARHTPRLICAAAVVMTFGAQRCCFTLFRDGRPTQKNTRQNKRALNAAAAQRRRKSAAAGVIARGATYDAARFADVRRDAQDARF